MLAACVVAVIAGAGIYTWSQVSSFLSPTYQDVLYTVPQAPGLTALDDEQVYRIDPTRSSLTYGVDEKLAGQSASHAEGSTNGIAGDLAINTGDPSASRVGEIVANVEQFHSDNRLRDARIRDDYLESHEFPLATFDTESLSGLPKSFTEGNSYPFSLSGNLTVHGVTAPVTWDATAQIDNGELTASATTTVRMSTFDVGPISLAGLVSTGDEVSLRFDLTAMNPSTSTVPTQIAAPPGTHRSGHSPSFEKEVQPILAANCASCHNTGQVGAEHWVMDDAGDAADVAEGIATVTRTKYMPPWPASDVGVPLEHAKTLSQDQIAVLAAWANAGGQLDVASDAPITPSPGSSGPQPRHDLTLQMPEPYTGSIDVPNDYRCFVLDPEITEPTYITGYEVTADQRPEIHHAQVFHINAGQAAEGLNLSGKDGQPGWSCYSGPNLPNTTPTSGTRPRRTVGQAGLIAGWVPGQDPSIYPNNSGILFQPGDAVVFQIHYHYENDPTPDQSTIYFQTDPGTADIKPIDIVNPLAPVEIPCMPGVAASLCDRQAALEDNARLYGPSGSFIEPGLLLACGKTPEALTAGFAGVASSSCDTRVPETGDIVAAMGHMHTIGKSFRLTLDPDGPDPEVLLDIPVWNFDWQMNYQLERADPCREGPDRPNGVQLGPLTRPQPAAQVHRVRRGHRGRDVLLDLRHDPGHAVAQSQSPSTPEGVLGNTTGGRCGPMGLRRTVER